MKNIFKGTLHEENEHGQIWESENKRWVITKYYHNGKAQWIVENPYVKYYDNPAVTPTGRVIFNKPAGMPTYVREQFLEMVQDYVTQNTQ